VEVEVVVGLEREADLDRGREVDAPKDAGGSVAEYGVSGGGGKAVSIRWYCAARLLTAFEEAVLEAERIVVK
jgi:hypothetical protein